MGGQPEVNVTVAGSACWWETDQWETLLGRCGPGKGINLQNNRFHQLPPGRIPVGGRHGCRKVGGGRL